MKKLNGRKIRWICREMEKGGLSVYRIARLQKITPQYARRVYRKYRGVERPRLLPCGRTRPISEEERMLVVEMRRSNPVGAVSLEKLLDEMGHRISHNRIHRILLMEGLSKPDPKRQKRRKHVRYERRHSNSLWHADWFEDKRDQIIVFEDDASRLITGYGIFKNATARNAKNVLQQAIEEYGAPTQLITDHGTQFTSLARETCSEPEPNEFQRFLSETGIRHIKARVKHPQSNGKVERLFATLRRLHKHFLTWDATIEYYNVRRPHMSLENGKLRTPIQAFKDKTKRR